jgi:hypothetical protein
MTWRCPCTSVLIILVLIFLVLFFALNFKKFLKFVKYLKFKKQKPSNLLYVDKSIRPVTVIKCANDVYKNKKIQKTSTKTNEFSPSLINNETNQQYINLQTKPVGTYLLQNTGT